MTQQTLILHGCTPVPLAGYLKALGVLRIVSMQADPQTQGWWQQDVFHLRCSLNETELTEFFVEEYQPTPIIGPWGARSGFYPGSSEKSAREALDIISGSDLPRLEFFRSTIALTQTILRKHQIHEKPAPGVPKDALMRLLRNELPDSMLEWLDCVYVLLDDRTAFPPILGTGGNEGSGSYTSAYAQAIVEVILNRKWDTACRSSLFGTLSSGVTSPMLPGHFDPGATGGPNAGGGYSGQTTLNPWTLLLMLEGTQSLASGTTRKSGSAFRNTAAFPFSVESAGAGYGSSALSDEASRRPEIWLPQWNSPSTQNELLALFSEGRATIGVKAVRTAVDFAIAIASFGIDRGIVAFERYGFQLRNGDLSNFAIQLGTLKTQFSSNSQLVRELESGHWLDRFRRTATGKSSTATAAASLRKLESAIINTCQQNDSSGQSKDSGSELLIALGVANATIAASPKLREADYPVPPVPLLSPQWLQHCYAPDSTHAREFRLAASLASIGFGKHSIGGPLRQHLEPIDVQMLTNKRSARASWAKHPDDPAIVWSNGNLVRNLVAVLQRRLIDVSRSNGNEFISPISGRCPANLDDVSAFLNQETDDRAIESLLRGLTLIDWNRVAWEQIPWMSGDPKRDFERKPSAAWCLLKLCLLPDGVPSPDGLAATQIRLQPQIFRLAANGRLAEATALAAQRLRSSGLRTAVETIYSSADIAARTTAALIFPIYGNPNQRVTDITRIRDQVLFKSSREESGSADTVVRGNSM
ncbi:type I-U CRISPR-associated protein Csx17 [Marinobacter sp.]|uniref:type I-G CRISPR-associated protein Cas8g1/Csx17 n=1 Tax=Marinobacter sp. TaxID=50741 RepID=UPI003A92FDC8